MFRLYHPLSPETELVYYSSWTSPPSKEDLQKLREIIPGELNSKTALYSSPDREVIEIGPRLSMRTPWSDIAKEICHSAGLANLDRIEKAFRTSQKDPEWDPLQMEIYPVEGLNSWKPTPFEIDYQKNYQTIFEIPVSDFRKYNTLYGLGLDERDISFYTSVYNKLGRNATNLELYDLGQSNSEHSRHWIFNSAVYLDGQREPESMFQLVKKPFKKNPGNSLVAFADNSSVIKGFPVLENGCQKEINFCLTAETHNFPTGICPFPGAATGIGGRIRDVIATGRGATMIAGTAGYSVGNFPFENLNSEEKRNQKILVQASNGASDYGNKVGEPIILGYTRTFTNSNLKLSFRKPIMFTGGLGHIYTENLYKAQIEPDLIIIRVGGPTYRIGLGGGSASSRSESNHDLDYQAVQRGDPEMENRLTRFVSRCTKENPNPILSIHDQGAGGMANVTKEIVTPVGGIIQLDEVRRGDPTLSPLEVWCSESQEQATFLVKEAQVPLVQRIAQEEGLELEIIGYTTESGLLEVCHQDKIIATFDLELMLEKIPSKIMRIEPNNPVSSSYLGEIEFQKWLYQLPSLRDLLIKVLQNPTVSSKSFLTNKVDRSVSGLIAQQQTLGKYQIPLSDYALVASSYDPNPETNLYTGTLLGIGEQPLKGVNDPSRMVEMTFGEMLLNMVGVKIDSIDQIRISGNWMWAPKEYGYGYTLYQAVKRLSKLCFELGPCLDGGKDSLSMTSRNPDGEKIISPPTLVLSGYAPVPNLEKRVTSALVPTSGKSYCLLIDFSKGQNRLGGSILAQEYLPNSGFELEKDLYPRMDDPVTFRNIWTQIQELIGEGLILAAHDRSDGGLLGTLIEMTFPNHLGLKILEEAHPKGKKEQIKFYFNEELGLVIQVREEDLEKVEKRITGGVIKVAEVTSMECFQIPEDSWWTINQFREIWQARSYQLEKEQANPEVIKEEYENLPCQNPLRNNSIGNLPPDCLLKKVETSETLKALILRQDGSNGDREMEAVFQKAGFVTVNAKTNQLLEQYSLMDFDCLVMVGGFSNGDVLGSANGWAQTILQNPKLKDQFNQFFKDPSKYSLGVCNGFQLMVRLGLFGEIELLENDSGRFESRWVNLEINSDCPLLKPLERVVWGCWIAHGEGKLSSIGSGSSAIQYSGFRYPHNPNGSFNNLAGLITSNGHHLGMMPHPERSFLKYQNAWIDPKIKTEGAYTPWMALFQSYYNQIALNKNKK